LAATLVERFGLVPPVPVRELAESFAEIEEAAIPGACDGLAIGLSHARPRIVIRPRGNTRRVRFTVAHELGHILLPWHVGSNLACLTGRGEFDDYRASAAETEANRFAAELLVPDSWLRPIVQTLGVQEIAPLLHAVQAADVSAHVAALKLAGALPPGFGFVLLDGVNRVELAGQSPGLNLPIPKRGQTLDAGTLDRMAARREALRYGTREMVWWSFHQAAVSAEIDQPGTSREALAAIVRRHVSDDSEYQRIYGCISSVIGAANSQAGHDGRTKPEELHARFRSRFAVTRRLPESLLIDAEFETWLERRAVELGR
jgi:hypothetical protein